MHGRTMAKTVVRNQSYGPLIKKILRNLGATIGITCIPITVFDAVGYPASIVGSSMEVVFYRTFL